MTEQPPPLWELPDVLLFHIVTFLAPASRRAQVLCEFSALCKDAYQSILLDEERPLWDTVSKEDYGSVMQLESSRRVSKRLRRSPVHRVRDAHKLLKDNTEIAFFYLTEMTNATKDRLTKAKMSRLLEEYGPHLRYNSIVSSGGVFLVQVCRAKQVKESVILRCVQDLVETRGALVDTMTNESPNSHETALCVAAVRAMPSVVRYLLSQGASTQTRSSGRFRLHTQSKKTLRCLDVTPLEFCTAMRDAEVEAGASPSNLKDLEKCIRLLQKAMDESV